MENVGAKRWLPETHEIVAPELPFRGFRAPRHYEYNGFGISKHACMVCFVRCHKQNCAKLRNCILYFPEKRQDAGFSFSRLEELCS